MCLYIDDRVDSPEFRQRFQKEESDLVIPSGLKWHNAGTTEPAQGRELKNSRELADALTSKTEFTQFWTPGTILSKVVTTTLRLH